MKLYIIFAGAVCFILCTLSFFVAPTFKPAIDYKMNQVASANNDNDKLESDVSQVNRLYIDSIAVDMEIFEGTHESTLDKGLWRRPHTSTPNVGSNTVIAGHRLAPIGKSESLYNLDKVKIDDEVYLDWNGTRYSYKVDEIKIVSPFEVSIEKPTPDDRLTIYTCTPLFVYSERLVVTAKLTDSTR